jgi:hypothetical protein
LPGGEHSAQQRQGYWGSVSGSDGCTSDTARFLDANNFRASVMQAK